MSFDESIKVRMPSELREKIKAAADQEQRSEGNMIRLILERYFQAKEGFEREEEYKLSDS